MNTTSRATDDESGMALPEDPEILRERLQSEGVIRHLPDRDAAREFVRE